MPTPHKPPNRRRDALIALAIVLGAATVGLTIFGALAWRAVTIRRTDESDALRQFTTIRARLPASASLVHRDASDRFVGSPRSATASCDGPATFRRGSSASKGRHAVRPPRNEHRFRIARVDRG